MRYLISFVLAVLFGFFSDARAAEVVRLDCKVAEVLDASIFEESLSVEEHPGVRVTEDPLFGFELKIGANRFRSASGDRIVESNEYGHNVTAFRVTFTESGAFGKNDLVVFASEPQNGEDFMPGYVILESKPDARSNVFSTVARVRCAL